MGAYAATVLFLLQYQLFMRGFTDIATEWGYNEYLTGPPA